jgi:hypothetical protein
MLLTTPDRTYLGGIYSDRILIYGNPVFGIQIPVLFYVPLRFILVPQISFSPVYGSGFSLSRTSFPV